MIEIHNRLPAVLTGVTLVTGAPCSGKNTWVERRKRPFDRVVDRDILAQEAGSPSSHSHTLRHWQAADRAFGVQCDVLAAEYGKPNAFVIATVPEPDARAALAHRCRARTTVVLLPPESIAIARAAERDDPDSTIEHIRRWYRCFDPLPTDVIITG